MPDNPVAQGAALFPGEAAAPSPLGVALGRPAIFEDLAAAHSGIDYRAPLDLRQTQLEVKRILLIGSCLVGEWMRSLGEARPDFDYILTNNFSGLPETPPVPLDSYDFALVQIPLRSVLHENTYSHLPFDAPEQFRDLLEKARGWTLQYLDTLLRWNEAHGMLTFVTNFLVPQQNPMGRLLPRNDLRNMVYFIEQLNVFLADEIARRRNVYLLDIDQIASSVGKRNCQDDGAWTISHGSILNDAEYEADQGRIQPLPKMTEHYLGLASGRMAFYQCAWVELVAMYRTLRQIDMVKLVVLDLDDTLWRGVVAESGQISSQIIEGWPIGVMEALCFLKKRGMLLGILSKNDDDRIRLLWDSIVGGRLPLESFAVRRINWRSKAENMGDILREVNLTPRNVVFVDDNPVERAAMQAAYPEMRILGANPYYLKRILLWSAETQLAAVTAESGRRTQMVQARAAREELRETMSRPDFLASLGIRVTIGRIAAAGHEKFPRALELINKTNQFNTTGRRWSMQECVAFFADGGCFYTIDVQDRFSHHGLVAVAVVCGPAIEQFVMSCRVVGLEIEYALLGHVLRQAAVAGIATMMATVIETELNLLARDIYRSAGFVLSGTRWLSSTASLPPPPAHIAFATAGELLPAP